MKRYGPLRSLIAVAVILPGLFSGCMDEPLTISLSNSSGEAGTYTVTLTARDTGDELFNETVTLVNGSRERFETDLRTWPGMDLHIGKDGAYNATEYIGRQSTCRDCYVMAYDYDGKLNIRIMAYE